MKILIDEEDEEEETLNKMTDRSRRRDKGYLNGSINRYRIIGGAFPLSTHDSCRIMIKYRWCPIWLPLAWGMSFLCVGVARDYISNHKEKGKVLWEVNS